MSSATERPRACCSEPLSTFGLTLDVVVAIEAAGREEVFDIEVERTENFVADGLISHNTRWHDDDLAGRLTKGSLDDELEPWRVINVPAIIDEGTEKERAFWEAHVPLKRLKAIRAQVGPYAWAALYQGHPVPLGSTVFGDPTFFQQLPGQGFQIAQGLDLSYTEKKSSDYSVVVTMLRAGEYFYVRRVFRAQKRAPDFKADLRAERTKFKSPRIRMYASGTETGAIDFMRKPEMVRDPRGGQLVNLPGVTIEAMDAEGDKFTRAIPFAAAWNAGKVLVPSPELIDREPIEYAWVNDFLAELKSFTGVKDPRDDQVDAAVAAFDILNVATASSVGWGKVDKPPGRRM